MFSVGMVGLGAMGQGMARNLAKAGFLHTIYNRTAEKAIVLAKELNVVADSIENVAKKSNVICICVSRDEDLLDVIEQLYPCLNPQTIIVDMSTVSSQTAENVFMRLKSKHVEFLDAPVSGGVEGAKNGQLAMMVGGENVVLEKVRPVLEAMASKIIYIGKTGSGQATKAVNQIMAAGINQAVTEALAFAQNYNLHMEKIIDVISNGAAGNWFLTHRGLSMTQGLDTEGFKLELHHKDLMICLAMAKVANIDLPLTEKTRCDYEMLIAQNLGNHDISALYRLKKSTC